jgi:hypothetical protein
MNKINVNTEALDDAGFGDGVWFDSDTTMTEIEDTLIELEADYGISDNTGIDMYLNDVSTSLDITIPFDHNDDIEDMLDTIYSIDSLSADNADLFEVLVDDGYSIDSALERIDELYYICSDTSTDFFEYITDTGVLEVPDHLMAYIDIDKVYQDFVTYDSHYKVVGDSIYGGF